MMEAVKYWDMEDLTKISGACHTASKVGDAYACYAMKG